MKDSKNDTEYILSVGDKGQDRLLIQHGLFETTSRRFLKTAGLKSGMRVLDMGCGTGLMVQTLAELVGPSGEVIAIDNSQAQLEIAKHVEFPKHVRWMQADVMHLPDSLKEYFDFIYCRFFFNHLVQMDPAVDALMACLKIRGVLACENIEHSTAYALPESSALEEFKQLVASLEAKLGLVDSSDQIYASLRRHGLKHIRAKQIQPNLTQQESRSLYKLCLDELKSVLVGESIEVPEKLNALSSRLEDLAVDDKFLTYFQNTQISAVKAA